MSNIIDVLSVSQYDNTKINGGCLSSSNINGSTKESFLDVLNSAKNNNVTSKKQSYTNSYDNLDNVSIFNVSNISSSNKSVKFLDKLNSALSNKSADLKDDTKALVDDISKVIEDTLLKIDGQDLTIEEENQITEEALQTLMALLDNFMINNNTLALSVEDVSAFLISDLDVKSSMLDGLDFDLTEISDGHVSDLLDNISDNLNSLFESSSISNENCQISDFMDKISEILTKSEELSSDTDLDGIIIKKEDISTNVNNLNISPILNTNMVAADLRFDNVESLHPITKQILQTMQSQLASVDLSESNVEVRLKLYPSKLGEILVTIERISDAINVNIASENADVRGLLSDAMDVLKQNLNDSNYTSVNINISSGDSNGQKQERNNSTTDTIESLNKYIEDVELKLHSSTKLLHKLLDIKI